MNRLMAVLMSMSCFAWSDRALAHGDAEQVAIGTASGQHGLLCQMLAAELITPEQAQKAVDMIIEINQQDFAKMEQNSALLLKNAFNFSWNYTGEIAKNLHPSCPLGTTILK